MGGQGPPYPSRFQSFVPSRVPAGRSFAVAPSGKPAQSGGMSWSTQCTYVILGALGSGASGSSTMSARLLAPDGTPEKSSGGARSAPSQVWTEGISPPAWKAGEMIVSDMETLLFQGRRARTIRGAAPNLAQQAPFNSIDHAVPRE